MALENKIETMRKSIVQKGVGENKNRQDVGRIVFLVMQERKYLLWIRVAGLF